MTDDDQALASAYLDGELDRDGCTEVEANPLLLAEVERLRHVRAILSDIEPASISLREQHLAAALDAWDNLPEGQRRGDDPTPGSLITAAPVSSLDQRRRARQRRNRLLTAAAAVVVVAGGVAVVASSDFGGTDSDSTSAQQTDLADEVADPLDDLALDAGNEFGSLEQATEPLAEAPQALADEAADSAGADAVAAAPVGGPEAPPREDDLDVLESRDDLAAFAAFALDVPDVTSDGTDSTEALEERAESADAETESIDPVPSCGFDIVAGPALYQGQPVVVAVDLRRSLAIAYLAIDCSVIDRAPLP
jgi:hypothetical protein